MMKIKAALILLFLIFPSLSVAMEPEERLGDIRLEERARSINQKLRCLVCQNESIDTSEAPMATDLRMFVRERLEAGETDQKIIEQVVERYGDFVLLKPPIKQSTYFLWFGPLLVFFTALGGIGFYFLKQRHNFPQEGEKN